MRSMRGLLLLAVCATLGCATTPPVPSPPPEPEPDPSASGEVDPASTPPPPSETAPTPPADPSAPPPPPEYGSQASPSTEPAAPAEPAPAAEPVEPAPSVQPPRRKAPPRAAAKPPAAPEKTAVPEKAAAPEKTAEAYAGPDPCQVAVRGNSPVARACQQGGIKAAKTTMKDLISRARSTGLKLGCDDCHASETDYSELSKDAREKFANLLAAAKVASK
jgi:hypothetical protein